jgi:hypothetical protein
MKRGVIVACLCMLTISGVSVSEAAIRQWSFEPSVYGGFVMADADLMVDNDSTLGVRLALSVLPAFQIEAFADSYETKRADSNRSGTSFKEDYVGLRLFGTFLAKEDGRVKPFISVGAGTVNTEFDKLGDTTIANPDPNGPVRIRPDPEKDEATFGEFALGARIFLWRTFNIRPELALRQTRTVGVTHTNVQFTLSVSAFFFGEKQ